MPKEQDTEEYKVEFIRYNLKTFVTSKGIETFLNSSESTSDEKCTYVKDYLAQYGIRTRTNFNCAIWEGKRKA